MAIPAVLQFSLISSTLESRGTGNGPIDRIAEFSEAVPPENTGTYRELETAQRYIYRWDRQGRKGQRCKVTARGKFNSIRVVFDDGYEMITSGNAIRRAPDPAAVRA